AKLGAAACQPFKAKNRPRPTLRLRIDFLHISGFGRGVDDPVPKPFCCLVAARNCDFPRAWSRTEHRPSRRFPDALTSELPQNKEFRDICAYGFADTRRVIYQREPCNRAPDQNEVGARTRPLQKIRQRIVRKTTIRLHIALRSI